MTRGAVQQAQGAVRGGAALAFDFGLQRIGVAVGNRETATAQALTTIAAGDADARFGTIARLIAEWQPALLVVGVPTRGDGGEHPLAARCRRFADQLRGRFGLPVALVDEAYSSAEADGRLQARGHGWRERKQALDALAAQIILETYLSSPGAS
jgi:putative Holliday junction resolvase